MPIVSESERNRLLKRQRALLLAASDMEQATAAVHALAAEKDDRNLMLALETAIAVCYARAFTQSTLLRLSQREFEPADAGLATLHNELCDLRDKVYAHTDKGGGRDAALLVTTSAVELPGRVDFLRHDEWIPLPREALPLALELFEVQCRRFHNEAARIHLSLAGPPAA